MNAATRLVAMLLAVGLGYHGASQSKEKCALTAYTTVPLELADDRTILVPVTANEQRAYMMLDMGAPSADCRPCSPPLTMSLTTEGLKIINAQINLAYLRGAAGRFIPPRQGGAGGYEVERSSAFPLYLGINVLRQLHLYLATREHKLYFTPTVPAGKRDP